MPDRIRFVLDGVVRELDGGEPTLTVLRWLREVEGRTGTKEGCGEGDCGACTVVLADLRDGKLRYRAVDSCLLFLPALDGKALLTVESLCPPGAALHPVQREMVACHASQCGFCTPGFVMSLVALQESEPAPSRQRIDEVLAGNLCRCTGYRPIAEAAARAAADHGRSHLASTEAALAAQLRGLSRPRGLRLERGEQSWYAPRSLAEMDEVLAAQPGARIVAGATDLGLLVSKEHRRLGALVSLAEVEELGRVEERDGFLEIGGAATYSEALLPLSARHPDLGQLVRRLGSVQIRNLGTLGGNVANASPIGDMPPALLALGASLVLRRGGATRELPLDDFFLGYRRTALAEGEIVERIRLPPGRPGRAFRAYKVSKRFDQDISAVCGAFALVLAEGRVADIRIAYGGMAAVPQRARACEAALRGGPWTAAAVVRGQAALDAELAPISDMRASAAYRRLVARNLLLKFQVETGQGGWPGIRTRVLEPLVREAP